MIATEGAQIPSSVYREVFRYVGLMTEGVPDEDDVPSSFEESLITIGFTPQVEKELREHYIPPTWPNVEGGRPVAYWRSGLSTGCVQVLFMMPDGTFEWTEP